MNLYILLPLWIGIVAMLYKEEKLSANVLIYNLDTKRINMLISVVTFLPIILVVSFTEINIIGDYWGYIHNFLNLSISFNEIDWSAKEPGFDLIRVIIKSIFGNSETAFRLSIALIQSIPIIVIFRLYSSDYFLSVYLFITNGMYLSWMMNGVRQFLAVCIIFAATPLLLKKKFVPLILIILFAYTIHNSAIIMLPIVFLVQGRAWNKATVIFSILIVILFSNISFLDSAIENTGLDYSISNISQEGDDGTNILRVLINIIPLFLSFMYREKLDPDNRLVNICVNMSLVNSCIYVVSMFTSGILIGRLPGYTIMYNFILFPYLINYCVESEKSKSYKYFIILLFFIYYCFLIF